MDIASKVQQEDVSPECPTHTHTLRTDILLLDLGQRWTSQARMSSFTSCRAVEDQQNDCYIELYNILLRAFVSADCDFDGQVSQDEFGGMISAAAALPKKFGFDWWQGSPADMFKAIDDNGDGSVSFDEWLNFAYKNYQGQKDLPAAFDKQDKDQFVADCKEWLNFAYKNYQGQKDLPAAFD